MNVYCLISPYRKTNNYLIEISPRKFIGIDIGNIDVSKIDNILHYNGGTLVAYFVTHAHADHCIGLEEIYERYRIPIYCSEMCAKEMNNSRSNFSFYSDEIPSFEYNIPVKKLIHKQKIIIEEIEIEAIAVPGHSAGCMAYFLENQLFTGDFLMLKDKTPLNFPNSSKKDYLESLKQLNFIKQRINVYYPGHGDKFHQLEDIKHIEHFNTNL